MSVVFFIFDSFLFEILATLIFGIRQLLRRLAIPSLVIYLINNNVIIGIQRSDR